MRTHGKCDFSQLVDLQKKIEKLERSEFEKLCDKISKELAARLLSKVIKRTPVGDYTGGGTLRRAWTVDNQTLVVEKIGNMYQLMVVNNTEYASYVEFGHRTVGGRNWVEGQYMLTMSENELNSQAPKIVERLVMEHLKGVFNESK